MPPFSAFLRVQRPSRAFLPTGLLSPLAWGRRAQTLRAGLAALALGLLALVPAAAQTYTITTRAGIGGFGGVSGDGKAATAAFLNEPSGVVVDGSGNVFIADKYNHRIRKINGATGVITTVAGGGATGLGAGGFSGDGSGGALTQLKNPTGVAVDGKGNVYIADEKNHRIRKMSGPRSVVTTVAGTGTSGFSGDGGPATSAQLNFPHGLAIDGSGNIFIADQSNHRIRKVNGATGVVTTVAGTGTEGFSGDGGPATSAQLNSPGGVAVDGSGNVFIADVRNHCIRKVSAATGVITTVAGTGTEGFGGDEGAATSAQLNSPYGVAVDGSGNVFIADYSNHRIRKVSAATGVITTVAGSGPAGYGKGGFSGDKGAATSAQLNGPVGVTIDGSGKVYIADRDNHRIRQLTPASAAPRR